ncbi:ABC transporter ATP-binding protein [Bacillus sp. SM2101]|uniref:ABC transporter ATP-binding protein n=1 Tax=Bacillus sp. SM2101 TaxID=2805366 RepID=UPI001BDE0BE0|nr:ABC transporter ATP-binding protein [Bacillus sp. SM2101]
MDLIQIFKNYLTKRTVLYVISFVFLIVSEILNVIPPKLIGNIIDLIEGKSITASELFIHVFPLFLIAILHFGVIYIWSSALFGGEFFIQKELRQDLFFRTLFNKAAPKDSGSAMTIMNNDINKVGAGYGFGILSFMSTFIGLIVVIYSMSTFISWKLTVVSLLPLPIIVYLVKRLGRKIHQKTMGLQSKEGTLNNHISEFYSGIRLIRIFSLERKYTNQFIKANKELTNSGIDFSRINSMFQPLIVALIRTSYVIALGFGSYLISVGDITIGELITFTLYINLLHWPVTAFGDFISLFQQGNASAKRYNDYINNTDIIKESTFNLNSMENISLKDFSLFKGKKKILKNINLDIKKGENIAIVGKTGSGKSSLLNFLTGDYEKYEGTAFISNKPYKDITPKDLVKLISYSPQDPMNFSKTIYENLTLGKKYVSKQVIRDVLEITGFDKELEKSNLTLDSFTGGSGKNLSGGQLQKLSLCRSLIKNTELLLLDDVFSSMDSKNTLDIFSNILEFRQGKTNIFVTNNFDLTPSVDKIIVLIDGEVVEFGEHSSLLQSSSWYSSQYKKHEELCELEKEERGLYCGE